MFKRKNIEPVISVKVHQKIVDAQEIVLRRTLADKEQAVANAEAIQKERDELKAMVREQTEADLLLISLKTIDEIKAGKKREDESLASLQDDRQRLFAQRERALGCQTYAAQGLQGMLNPYGGGRI